MSTIKPLYGASAGVTSTSLQSLAYSSTGLGAWSSAVINNNSFLSDDEIITFVIKMGTSPTAGQSVECWCWEIMDDTPTYPDTVTGSEGTITLTSANVKYSGAFKLAGLISVDATTGRLYYLTSRLSILFSTPPKQWGFMVVNASGVALSSSGNVVTRTPIQYQVV